MRASRPAFVVAAVVAALAGSSGCGSESANDQEADADLVPSPPAPLAGDDVPPALVRASPPGPRGSRATCANRSEADFPGAFSDPDNLVVGPLVLVGAARYTPPEVVRKFGGNKFPALVAAGHTVTVHLPKRVRKSADLGWAPRGKTLRTVARRTVNFTACRPNQESGSRADGRKVTFWSGGIGTRMMQCLPLKVFVDGDPEPQRAFVEFGRSCERERAGTRVKEADSE